MESKYITRNTKSKNFVRSTRSTFPSTKYGSRYTCNDTVVKYHATYVAGNCSLDDLNVGHNIVETFYDRRSP